MHVPMPTASLLSSKFLYIPNSSSAAGVLVFLLLFLLSHNGLPQGQDDPGILATLPLLVLALLAMRACTIP